MSQLLNLDAITPQLTHHSAHASNVGQNASVQRNNDLSFSSEPYILQLLSSKLHKMLCLNFCCYDDLMTSCTIYAKVKNRINGATLITKSLNMLNQ